MDVLDYQRGGRRGKYGQATYSQSTSRQHGQLKVVVIIKDDDSPQQTITKRDRFDTSSENITGLPTFAEMNFGFPGSKGLMDERMLAKVYEDYDDLLKIDAEKTKYFGGEKI